MTKKDELLFSEEWWLAMGFDKDLFANQDHQIIRSQQERYEDRFGKIGGDDDRGKEISIEDWVAMSGQ